MPKYAKRVRAPINGTSSKPATQAKRKYKTPEQSLANRRPRLPRIMIRTRRQMILEQYAQGTPAEQIALKLDMPLQQVTKDLNYAIQEMVEQYSKPSPEQTFVRYASFQMGVVKQLGVLVDRCKDASAPEVLKASDSKQHGRQGKSNPLAASPTAWVSALRAQSDIYDKVMTKGAEFGVIEQRKADQRTFGRTDIRATLQTEIVQLHQLMEDIDDQTQRKSLRARVIQTKIKYAARVRVPIRTEMGIARAIPDWKYRQIVTDEGGDHVVLQSKLDEHQKLLLPQQDPDHEQHLRAAETQPKQSDSSLNIEEQPTTSRPPRARSKDKDSSFLVQPRKL